MSDENVESGPRIAAIVVTYNRLELLKRSVAAIRAQVRLPDDILVVDNGSEDGTESWLLQQQDLMVIRQENLGGSGGQYRGILQAYERGHDWFWCMDDDTIPEPEALYEFCQAAEFQQDDVGLLCSSVFWTDGTPHLMNIPVCTSDGTNIHRAISSGSAQIECCSFVSVLVRREAVKNCGLPLKDMFVWYDDVEFTQRIAKCWLAYWIVRSRVTHKTITNTGPVLDLSAREISFKTRHGMRNSFLFLRGRNCSGAERSLLLIKFALKRSKQIIKQAPASNWPAYFGLLFQGLFGRIKIEYPEAVSKNT